jgi:pimeloyl-ACP methyl ester carboxylesterase
VESNAERAGRRAFDEALASQFERIGIEELDEEWSRTPVLSGQSAAIRAAAREDRLRSTPEGLAAALRGLGAGALPPLWDRLGELTMPCRFLAGEADVKFTELAHEMAGLVPDGRAVVIPGAGHAAHLEAPALVAAEF